MRWIKQGQIYTPNQRHAWNQSHAQVPVVDVISDDLWRVYYASRDAKGKSRTSYIEVEARNPGNVLYEHDQPILPLGGLGTFDESGIMPAWVVSHADVKYLYYIGWSLRVTVPYHNAVGLARSEDNGKTFTKCGEGPLFGPTLLEPHFTGTCCVLIDEGTWKSWYLSCTKWEILDDKPEPFYHIKYAESSDGVHWERNATVAVDFASEEEGGLASASVLKCDGLYRMWYSSRQASGYRTDRQKSYRIGYAESPDGIQWTRMDEEAGIDVSTDGWDSEMIAYPHVLDSGGQKYMFYNGNGFGTTGFGYAVLEE